MTTVREELNRRIMRHYAQHSQLCQLGWTSFQAGITVSGQQFESEAAHAMCRDAFYMGMQHVFASLMQTLGDESSTEAADLVILESVTIELQAFLEDFLARNKIFIDGLLKPETLDQQKPG